MEQIPVKSPDKKHSLLLAYENEVRMGPAYYRAEIDELEVNARIFGQPWKWSDDSRYLALQEWMTTDYNKGPQTALVVFDLLLNREVEVSSANKGFIVPIRFEGSTLIYKKEYLGKGKTVEYDIDFESLSRWNDSKFKKLG